MSDCSNSVTKYIVVEPTSDYGNFSGLTVCGGGGITVDFITGCTSNGVNVGGGIFDNGVLTIPTINATTFSGGTYYGDGSNLLGITDSYMTGGTYSGGFITFSGNGNFSNVSVDVSSLLDDTNFYVTGQTLNGTTLETSRNGGLSTISTDLSSLQFTGNTSGSCISNFYVTNIYGCSPVTVHDDLIIDGKLRVNGPVSNFVLSLQADNAYDIATYRDVDGEDVFMFEGSLAASDLEFRIGDANDAYGGPAFRQSQQYNTTQFRYGNVYIGNSTLDLYTATTRFYVEGTSQVSGGLTADTMNIFSTPVVDNTIPDILVRDTDGSVKTRTLSTIGSSVTGLTFNSTTYDLTVSQNNGKPSYISNLSALASDIFVMSGVYDISTGIVTYTTNSGTTFEVSGFTSGMTDSYTTSSYIVGNEIRFDNNIQGSNIYNVDLTPLLSGKTDNSDFYIYTGSTQDKLDSKVDNSVFTTYTANTQTALDTKIDSGFNNGGGHEVLSGITGTDIHFRTLSGGSNTTLSTIGDVIKIDVTIPADTNSYVTGGTVSGTDLILGRNGGLPNVTIDTTPYFDNTDRFVTGATMNSNVLELSRSGGLSDVTVDLSQFMDNTNYYVTGSTMNGNVLELSRNGGLSTLTTDLSQFIDNTDNFVTGATYSNGTITLSRQNGTVDVDVPDAYITGATLNGTDLELSRNEGLSTLTVDLSSLVDGTNYYVTGGTVNGTNLELGRNGGLSDVIIDTSAYFDNIDNYVTGATMNVNTLELSRSGGLSDVTVDLSQFVDDSSDGVVSGATMNGNTLELGRTQGLSDVTVDLSQFVDIDTNYYVTGSTLNGNTLEIGRNGGLSTLTTDLSQFLDNTDNFVTGGTMVGTTLVLNRTNALSAVTIDMSQFIDDTNSYVTGGTVTGTDLILGRNGGLSNVTIDTSDFFDNTDRFVTGATMNVNTLELSRSGGLPNVTVDLSQFVDDTNDGVVSGATMNGNTLELGRTQGLSDVTVDLSQFIDNTDSFVTGSTLNGNTLELGRNGGFSTLTTDLSGLNPDTTLDRKLFIPAVMASTMGSSGLVYHGNTGVSFLSFGGNSVDNNECSFPMVVPQDYVSGGTFELIYTSQSTVNDIVWSFSITNCATGVDFSIITESGPHMDLVVSGQTFLNRGTTPYITPTGTTFNTYDAVTVKVNRNASDSRDTANNITSYIYGLIFNYKANN